MPLSLPNRPPSLGGRTRPLRRLWSWWRRLSPSRQDRMATLGPLLSVLLFLAAIVAAFWYLRTEERDREVESVKRDAELVQQQIRLRLIDHQEQIVLLARDLVTRTIDREQLVGQAESLMRNRPEIVSLTWLGQQRQVVARYVSPDLVAAMPRLGTPDSTDSHDAPRLNATLAAFSDASTLRLPVYSRPFPHENRLIVFQVHVPLIDHGNFAGTLMAEYSIDKLLRSGVPPEVSKRRVISLLNAEGEVMATTFSAASAASAVSRQHRPSPGLTYNVPFAPVDHGVTLRGEGHLTSVGLVGNTLFWMVLALSALTLWMLFGTWRHMRRRLQIQGALVQETNFRRAMENSMLTGMRAMDKDGRITYVNPAFCAMTGFTEAELIGRLPPFPHWPPERMEESSRLLQQELAGRSPAGGIEVRVQRKDGTQFDARMYVSPLIDPRGHQTGWMTSMTNITEAKRIRDQLTASHERFTTVLEGLDAAVSVLSVQTGELLFANRTYRLWFGGDAHWHTLLAGRPPKSVDELSDAVDGMGGLPTAEMDDSSADAREVFSDVQQKWFDARPRYLQWTDGRLAQMLIATDITARRRMEEQTAHQIERAQATSRLVTMGEMASSVAHELNQPLAAINNYCSGMLTRQRAGTLRDEDLVSALEKTAKQAQRAGQIIHRIRQFVKRSEPQRQPTRAADIVDDTLELAGLELRRRNVAIHSYVAQRLPVLQVDPILIEQVLLNLLKNAAEAIDNAQMPPKRRTIELRVVPRHTPEMGGVIEFSVTDAGPGLKEDVSQRLYEAFFSTKADGMGIGLSLCRSIIESHQGRIKAENLYNAESITGCRFSFMLPVGTAGDSSKPSETH
ncbi:PAS domain S-box protein [Sphaerotilus sp.]|uniref:PAS domain S-box protein n=1 Tax=Sphaerotilus sp. TaxID=2093942 RepID=UPI0025E49576|nr:PAS domain S-box protein [Sphaerotilus sp.]